MLTHTSPFSPLSCYLPASEASSETLLKDRSFIRSLVARSASAARPPPYRSETLLPSAPLPARRFFPEAESRRLLSSLLPPKLSEREPREEEEEEDEDEEEEEGA